MRTGSPSIPNTPPPRRRSRPTTRASTAPHRIADTSRHGDLRRRLSRRRHFVGIPTLGTPQSLAHGPAVASGHPEKLEAWIGSRIHRSEEHTSELQSLMRISYAVFCLK